MSEERALSPRPPPGRRSIRSYMRARAFDAKCLILIAIIRIALSTIGYSAIDRRLPRPPERSDSRFWARQVARRIERLARFVPRASCLTQALTLQYVLGRRGHASHLLIGVRQDHEGKFLAHAWVTCNGRVVLGEHDTQLAQYTRIAERT